MGYLSKALECGKPKKRKEKKKKDVLCAIGKQNYVKVNGARVGHGWT